MHTTHSLQQIYVFTLCKMRARPESLGACGNEKKGSKTGWVSLWKGGQKNKQFLCENYTNKHERIHSSLHPKSSVYENTKYFQTST